MHKLPATNLMDFDTFMSETMGFFRLVDPDSGEVCYQHTLPRTTLAIRVMSGLHEDDTPMPLRQQQGVRICVIELITGSLKQKPLRIRRTPNTFRAIREKVGLIWKQETFTNI